MSGDDDDELMIPAPTFRKRRRRRKRIDIESILSTDADPAKALPISGRILLKHGVRADTVFDSATPRVHTSNIAKTYRMYSTDFFFRLLHYSRQLMYIGKMLTLGKTYPKDFPHADRKIYDPCISKHINELQHTMFRDCEKILKRSMTFPDGCDRTIPSRITDGVAAKIHDHMHSSSNSYMFRYQVLRLINDVPSYREHVRQMVPPLEFMVMTSLLKRFFVSKTSSGFDGSWLFDDNRFMKIVQLIQSLSPLYMARFGFLRSYQGPDVPPKETFTPCV